MQFEHPSIHLLVGKSKSGKSVMLKYLILKQCLEAKSNRFQFGLVFSTTAFNGAYEWLPEKAVKEEYDEDYLKTYVNNLKKLAKNLRNEGKEMPHSFLILDDCFGELTANSKFFKNFIATCRHAKISVYIAAQQIGQGSSTVIRQQTDYAMLWYTGDRNELEFYYNHFGSLYPSKKEFYEAFARKTSGEYDCMLYVNSKKNTGNDWRDNNYYTMSAPDPKDMPDVKITF